jgi:hypothetical protein
MGDVSRLRQECNAKTRSAEVVSDKQMKPCSMNMGVFNSTHHMHEKCDVSKPSGLQLVTDTRCRCCFCCCCCCCGGVLTLQNTAG